MTTLSLYHDRVTFENDVERIKAYHKLFSTEEGKRVLLDIAVIGGLYDSQLSQNANEALQNDGKRWVINKIISLASINKIKEVIND